MSHFRWFYHLTIIMFALLNFFLSIQENNSLLSFFFSFKKFIFGLLYISSHMNLFFIYLFFFLHFLKIIFVTQCIKAITFLHFSLMYSWTDCIYCTFYMSKSEYQKNYGWSQEIHFIIKMLPWSLPLQHYTSIALDNDMHCLWNLTWPWSNSMIYPHSRQTCNLFHYCY